MMSVYYNGVIALTQVNLLISLFYVQDNIEDLAD